MARRRSVLAAGGGLLAALAGCLSPTSGRPSGRTDTASNGTKETTTTAPATTGETGPLPFGRPYDGDGFVLEPRDPAVRESLVYSAPGEVESHRRLGIHDGGGDRFLLLGVDVSRSDGDRPPRSAYRVAVSGDRFESWTQWLNFDWEHPDGNPYGNTRTGSPGSMLGFTLPAPVSGDPELVFRGENATVRWSLPDDVVEELAAPPPEWELLSHDVDTSDVPGSASIEFENVGDGDGLFRAVLVTEGNAYYSRALSYPVAPGESRTVTARFPSPRGGSPVHDYLVDTVAGGFSADA